MISAFAESASSQLAQSSIALPQRRSPLTQYPPTDPLPTDYRTVGGVGSALGEETLLAISEARHIQHFVSELVDIEP